VGFNPRKSKRKSGNVASATVEFVAGQPSLWATCVLPQFDPWVETHGYIQTAAERGKKLKAKPKEGEHGYYIHTHGLGGEAAHGIGEIARIRAGECVQPQL
jgi:hypothetical protein